MPQIKKILVVFLLFGVTVTAVFLPPLVSQYGKAKQLNQTTLRTYEGARNLALTGKEVASLVYSLKEADAYSQGAMNFMAEDYDRNEVDRGVHSLIETVFAEDAALCDDLKQFTKGSLSNYERQNILFNINNSPVVLNFLRVGYEYNKEAVEFVYEAKTQTLLGGQFSHYYGNGQPPTYFDMDRLVKQMTQYYTTTLGLQEKEFQINVETNQNGFYLDFSILSD